MREFSSEPCRIAAQASIPAREVKATQIVHTSGFASETWHRTLRAKRLGFGAKLCIHPRQVSVVNECFEPTAEEENWAKRIVEAAEAVHGAAVSVDGKMVDRPVIARAEAILSRIKQRSQH